MSLKCADGRQNEREALAVAIQKERAVLAASRCLPGPRACVSAVWGSEGDSIEKVQASSKHMGLNSALPPGRWAPNSSVLALPLGRDSGRPQFESPAQQPRHVQCEQLWITKIALGGGTVGTPGRRWAPRV